MNDFVLIELQKMMIDLSCVDPATTAAGNYSVCQRYLDAYRNRLDRLDAHPALFHHHLSPQYQANTTSRSSVAAFAADLDCRGDRWRLPSFEALVHNDCYLSADEGPNYAADAVFSMAQYGFDMR